MTSVASGAGGATRAVPMGVIVRGPLSPLDMALTRFRQASVPGSSGDATGASSSASTSASGPGGDALAGSPSLHGNDGPKGQAASESQTGGGSPARRDGSVTPMDSETEETISQIETQTKVLEKLNALEAKLNDDLFASLEATEAVTSPKTEIGAEGEQQQQHKQQPGWHLVTTGGGSKKADSTDGETAGCKREGSDGEDDPDCQPRKRVFSKYDEETTSILTEWFLAHKRWPYPASKEKDMLAAATKLTTLQISNWFTNKRKRHWTPVIKKRTRSPRDFFEFCVMNPKEALIPMRSTSQLQRQQQQNHHTMQHLHHHHHLHRGAPHPHTMTGIHPQGANDMRLSLSPSSESRNPYGAHDSFNSSRAAGPVGVRNHGAVMQGAPWGSHSGAGGISGSSVEDGAGHMGWLDHTRGSEAAGGPSGLAAGLVYASDSARQAANLDTSSGPHHHMLTGWSARAAMEQRSQGFGYDGARRTPQVAGISSGSQPRGKDTGMHGFDPAEASYRTHASYPPPLQSAAAAQVHHSVHANASGSSLGSVPGSSSAGGGAQGSGMWAHASYRNPSDVPGSAYEQQQCRQRFGVADQRYSDANVPFYKKNVSTTSRSDGTIEAHHLGTAGSSSSTTVGGGATAGTTAGYSWCDTARPDTFCQASPAFAASGGGGGSSGASAGGGGAAAPVASSSSSSGISSSSSSSSFMKSSESVVSSSSRTPDANQTRMVEHEKHSLPQDAGGQSSSPRQASQASFEQQWGRSKPRTWPGDSTSVESSGSGRGAISPAGAQASALPSDQWR